MDDKQSKYVNNVISLLTKQRNDALDLNTKLQADLIMAQIELAEFQNRNGLQAIGESFFVKEEAKEEAQEVN